MADPALQPRKPSEVELLRNIFEQKLEEDALELPPLPRVAQQVMALTSSDQADAAELARVIQEDQSMAGHILRYANSTAFMARNPIQTLQQAVARLGMAMISQVAVAVAVRGKMYSAPGFEETIARLWHHAAASGAWGKEVARIRRRNVESAYLCGLLHNIGKPIVLQDLSAICKSRQLRVGHQALIELMETCHTEIGIKAAEQWGLPGQVVASIRHHRNYADAPSFGEEATITHCANLLADGSIDPESFHEDEFRVNPVIQALNFYPNEVDDLLDKAEGVKEMVEAMLV
jgi:HD-like signal output (HDOD) protein